MLDSLCKPRTRKSVAITFRDHKQLRPAVCFDTYSNHLHSLGDCGFLIFPFGFVQTTTQLHEQAGVPSFLAGQQNKTKNRSDLMLVITLAIIARLINTHTHIHIYIYIREIGMAVKPPSMALARPRKCQAKLGGPCFVSFFFLRVFSRPSPKGRLSYSQGSHELR